MPSLFTAVISEIEGGDTLADAALKSYPLLLVRAAEGYSAALAHRRSIGVSIAGADCEWLKCALAIGSPAFGMDV
jgi:hypothetical protein